MDCPGCGRGLRKSSVLGIDDSWRCDECGGVWVGAWVVNRLADGSGALIIKPNLKSLMVGGSNRCPVDGVLLGTPPGVPSGIAAWVCERCHNWWFTGDEIFRFAAGYKSRAGRVVGQKGAGVFVLPALAVLVLAVGLITSSYLATRPQRIETSARNGIIGFSARDLGKGRVLITFVSEEEVKFIEYKRLPGRGYILYPLEAPTDKNRRIYEVNLDGLEPGRYEARVGGREYYFEVMPSNQ